MKYHLLPPLTPVDDFNVLFPKWKPYGNSEGKEERAWVHGNVGTYMMQNFVGDDNKNHDNWHFSLCIEPSPAVLDLINKNMLYVQDSTFHFDAWVNEENEVVRISVCHGQIIGSRLLAKVRMNTYPGPGSVSSYDGTTGSASEVPKSASNGSTGKSDIKKVVRSISLGKLRKSCSRRPQKGL